MNKLRGYLFNKNRPYFALLLPLFFVLHGFTENFGFISLRDVASLLITYWLATVIIYFIVYGVFRNGLKAGLMTVALMAVYLFFGAFFDFMKAHSPVRLFYRYVFLLPFLISLLLIVFILLKRSKQPPYKPVLFLSVLLLIYITVDLVTIAWKSIHPPANRLATYAFARNGTYQIPDSCKKPDIYLLLFDEYASSASLKEQYQFDNSDIDSFFAAMKFRVLPYSRGNYNYTTFDMSALLNMKYVEGLNYEKGVGRSDFIACNQLIRDNECIKFLAGNGYEIVNLSIFDLAGQPTPVRQSLLPVKTRMITEGTLLPRIHRDFQWYFTNHKWFAKLFNDNRLLETEKNNNRFLKEVVATSTIKRAAPRFVYAHFDMPHAPFYYDRHGRRKADSIVQREFMEYKPETYLEYVGYVNQEIKKLITTLMKNTGSNAVIIAMGDHGFRIKTDHRHDFPNLNAVYLPNQDYRRFYDSITNVNQFRVLFNTLFNLEFPLIKDTAIYLKDKK
jgi:hypothetical protein